MSKPPEGFEGSWYHPKVHEIFFHNGVRHYDAGMKDGKAILWWLNGDHGQQWLPLPTEDEITSEWLQHLTVLIRLKNFASVMTAEEIDVGSV